MPQDDKSHESAHQDSKVEKSMEVAIPPKILPTKSHQKLGESLVRQQKM